MKYKILLVDDEAANLRVLERLFAREFDVLTASSGAEALTLLTIYDFALNEVKLGLQDGEGVDSNFIHTEKFVVLDRKGVVRGYYNGLDTASLSRLAEDITLLMLEKDKNEPSPVLAQLKGLWPIYIAVILAVVLFVWITRKPAKEPKI